MTSPEEKTITEAEGVNDSPITKPNGKAPLEPHVPPTGTPSDVFLDKEIRNLKRNLMITRIAGTAFVLFAAIYIGSITKGFTDSLQPTEAATITTGIIADRVNDNIPTFKKYVREQVPIMIGKVPDYVKQEAPNLRKNLEAQLENGIRSYSEQSAPELARRMDDFLLENKAAVGQMLQNGQDTQAQAAMGEQFKQTFLTYIDQTQVNGETLKSKIDQSLSALTAIDDRMKHLAANKNLTDNEKRARLAIAVLLRKVDENQPQIDAIKTNVQDQINALPLQGVLQWKGSDEAIFTAPGKPPVAFVRKPTPVVVAKPAPSTGKH